MSTPDQVNHAVDRLKRLAAGQSHWSVYAGASSADQAILCDRKIVADAYLAMEPIQQFVVVCDDSRETAVYRNGFLTMRRDANDAYEIADASGGKPCTVRTINFNQKLKQWPEKLEDLPEGGW